MIYLGLDPGLTGALAVIRDTGVAASHALPVMGNTMAAEKGRKRQHLDPYELSSMLRNLIKGDGDAVHVVLEYTQAGMKGALANYSLGNSSGIIFGILATLGLPFELVSPQEWKKEFGLIKKDKDASRTVAQQLFPAVNLSRKKDDGRAEALLLAEWGRRKRERTID